SHRVRRSLLSVAGALVLCAAGGIAWLLKPGAQPLQHFDQRRVTFNPVDLPVIHSAISPDGKYLGYDDEKGIHLQLLDTGEVQTLPLTATGQAGGGTWLFSGWYQDSTHLVASLALPGKLQAGGPLQF